MTQTGTVLGTSTTSRPSRRAASAVDAQTDVYSLGVVLFELLTGEVPFTGDNFVAVAMRHINEPAPSVLERRPDVPAARRRGASQRALAKDPDDAVPVDGRRSRPSSRRASRELRAAAPTTRRDAASRRALAAAAAAPRRRGGAVAVAAAARSSRARCGVVAAAPRSRCATTSAGSATAAGGGGGSGERRRSSSRRRGVRPVRRRQQEHDEEVGSATDGDPATYWHDRALRRRSSLGKPGVGLVLDAGRRVASKTLTVDDATRPASRRRDQGGRQRRRRPFQTVARVEDGRRDRRRSS